MVKNKVKETKIKNENKEKILKKNNSQLDFLSPKNDYSILLNNKNIKNKENNHCLSFENKNKMNKNEKNFQNLNIKYVNNFGTISVRRISNEKINYYQDNIYNLENKNNSIVEKEKENISFICNRNKDSPINIKNNKNLPINGIKLSEVAKAEMNIEPKCKYQKSIIEDSILPINDNSKRSNYDSSVYEESVVGLIKSLKPSIKNQTTKIYSNSLKINNRGIYYEDSSFKKTRLNKIPNCQNLKENNIKNNNAFFMKQNRYFNN